MSFIPFLACLIGLPKIAGATLELPYHFEVPWDISQKNNLLVRDFVVNEREPRSPFREIIFYYDVCINFSHNSPLSPEEYAQFERLVGKREFHYYTNDHGKSVLLPADTFQTNKKALELLSQGKAHIKYTDPGKIIPVSIEIEKIEDNNTEIIVPKKIIDTAGLMESGRRRRIDYLRLVPGKYKITVSLPSEVKLPPDTQTSLAITANYRY